MQNAVLLVQAQLSGNIGTEDSVLDSYYGANWEVRIGNSPNPYENSLCPGGPHLDSAGFLLEGKTNGRHLEQRN